MAGPRPRRFGRVNGLGVWTLYRRAVKRCFAEWQETLAGAAVSSLLFLAVFHIALGQAPEPLPGVSLISFLVPGLVLMAIAQKAFEVAAVWMVFDKLEGTIADIMVPPLSPGERALALALGAATSGLACGAVVAAVLMPFAPLPQMLPLPLIFFLVMAALMHALFGILAGLWAERWDNFAAAQTFGLVPLTYLSGAFFPTSGLPEPVRAAVLLNPAAHAVDGLRYGWLGAGERDPSIAALVLVPIVLVLAAWVWRLFARGYKIKA